MTTLNTTQLAALFLAQLGFGSALVFPFMPVRVTGKSFIRFYYGLILAFIGLFLLCLYRTGDLHGNYVVISALAVWIWVLSFTKIFTKLEEALLWVFALLSGALLVVYCERFLLHGFTFLEGVPRLVLFVSAAVFLSFHLMNMIFGHWYLVNRQLPPLHLTRTSKLLIAISYWRAATVAMAVWIAHEGLEANRFARLTDFMGHGIFFWARILAGVGLPVLVSHLAYSSAKIGSNQSATGIMYAGIVFVLMGEIMALYLYAVTGYFF